MPKSKIYPFSQTRKDYPKEGSYIIKENFEASSSTIEYDTKQILNTLNNEDPTQDFSDIPHINKEQLQKILYVVTKNIVEVSF